MVSREDLLLNFLKHHNWAVAERRLLAADASFRTYERLILPTGDSAVLMNAPAPENPAQFILVDQLLQKVGVRAPRVFASDLENGFVLLEDFGDDTFSKLLKEHVSAEYLYPKAIDTLLQVQQITSCDTGIPLYDAQKMMFEVSLLPDWFGQYVIPNGLSEQARESFMNLWQPLVEQIQKIPKKVVLLDYHVDNLMITPDKACGVLDFQDARWGPATYDLMSLLEDERRPVLPSLRQKMIDRYLQTCPRMDTSFIRETLSLVAMQRHTKVIGIFVRLCARDHKDKYLKMIPFVWSLIESHLDEPMFQAYREWLDTYIPRSYRLTVPELPKC